LFFDRLKVFAVENLGCSIEVSESDKAAITPLS
jgi:hypothetical protein